jgi:hypothetical protein
VTDKAPPDLADRAFRRRRNQDAALAVPVLGCFLLLTPVLNLFGSAGTLLGIPVSVLYIFTLWIGLIMIAYSLARAMSTDQS